MESKKLPRVISKKIDGRTVRFLHTIAVLMVLAGAACSLGFTLYTGRNNTSVLLVLLFTGWVVSPFIALLLINIITKRWQVFDRLILYSLMMMLTVCSVVIYSGLWSPPSAKTAFVFLVVPLLSWSLMGMILLAAKLSPSR
jgi:ACR3 family arsenite efflux pump ArsB